MSRHTTGKRSLLRSRRWSIPLLMLPALFGAAALVPSIAWANDLSTNSCAGSDVSVLGNGIVTNEPCAPGTTFTAIVGFTVQNNASASRYCVTLHLIPDGTVLKVPTDVTLFGPDGTSTIPGKKTIGMVGTISGLSSSTGLVCFGQAGTVSGSCAPGTCSTIAWNTSGSAACPNSSPPGGQCRHQQVCIQGYGASLSCKSGCTPTCGGTAVLTASVLGGTPGYTYTLVGSDGTSQTYPAPGTTTTTTSHDFSVTVTRTTTYTLTVTDGPGCQ